MRIDPSLTDGVDPFHVQPTSTAPKKHPMVKGLSGSMIRKESALDWKGICFFVQRQKKNFVTFRTILILQQRYNLMSIRLKQPWPSMSYHILVDHRRVFPLMAAFRTYGIFWMFNLNINLYFDFALNQNF